MTKGGGAGAPVAERRGIDGLAEDIDRHLVLLGNRSPSYLRTLPLVRALVAGPSADAAIVAKLQRAWRERVFTAYYERPLLLLAAFRQDALGEGKRHPLHAAFAAEPPDPSAVTREAVLAALSPTRLSLWLTLATRRVQTNEVSRSVVWQWPAHLAGCDGGKRPLALFDVGAAAGLNLVGDALGGQWSDAAGGRIPTVRAPQVIHRLGYDPQPLDARDDEDVGWMRACIWPGETERLLRFDAAVRAMRRAYDGPEPRPHLHPLHAGMVPIRLEAVARTTPKETFLLAYQTFVRGYIEVDKQEAYARGMRTWLAQMTPGRAAWIECEIADATGSPSASRTSQIVAHVNAGAGDVRAIRLGRCGYHPIDVQVDEAGAAELSRLTTARAGEG